MKIYIASSWKNRHCVEMLTQLLREKRHTVFSYVENNGEELQSANLGFETWVETPGALKCFEFDSQSAMNADITIYISPSGSDACCEIGMAYAKGKIILGLYAKGESLGLMRKCVTCWFDDYKLLIQAIQLHEKHNNTVNC